MSARAWRFESSPRHQRERAVSSVVELLVYTERVGGSNPSPPTKLKLDRFIELMYINIIMRPIGSYKKEKALALRRSGKSYREIQEQLGVAKSTLSSWLKGVEFSEEVKKEQIVRVKSIWAQNIRNYNAERQRQYLRQREEEASYYVEQVPHLTQEAIFFLGLGLFWGEGTKNRRFDVQVANADPLVVVATIKFLKECCDVHPEKLSGWIHTHENINPEEALSYWSRLSGISRNRIKVRAYRSVASRGSKPKRWLPYGTFHLRVQSVEAAKKVNGWLEGIKLRISMPE